MFVPGMYRLVLVDFDLLTGAGGELVLFLGSRGAAVPSDSNFWAAFCPIYSAPVVFISVGTVPNQRAQRDFNIFTNLFRSFDRKLLICWLIADILGGSGIYGGNSLRSLP